MHVKYKALINARGFNFSNSKTERKVGQKTSTESFKY